MNVRSIREENGFLYKAVIDSAQVNPYMQDLSVQYEVTKELFKSFGKKNIKIPTPEEMQAKKIEEASTIQAQAILKAKQMEIQGVMKDVGAR